MYLLLEIIETKQADLKSFLELHRTGLASCGIKLIAASVAIFIEIYEHLENNEIVLCWVSSNIYRHPWKGKSSHTGKGFTRITQYAF